MIKSFIAAGAIPAYRFVKFTEDGVAAASAASDKIIGVSEQRSVLNGQTADIYLAGEVVDIEAGGAFSAGDALACDSDGKAVAAASGNNIGAIALEAAAASGDVVRAVVQISRVIAA